MKNQLKSEVFVVNNEFVALKSVKLPVNVDDAIAMLGNIAAANKDADLILKVGEIKGIYTVYQKTGDAALLEQIIVEIATIVVKASPATASSVWRSPSSDPNSPFYGRTDLIYAVGREPADKEIVIEDLIKECLDKKGYKDNAYANYRAGLRKIFANSPKTFPETEIQAIVNILKEAKENPDYNHNLKSAANRMIKHINEFYLK